MNPAQMLAQAQNVARFEYTQSLQLTSFKPLAGEATWRFMSSCVEIPRCADLVDIAAVTVVDAAGGRRVKAILFESVYGTYTQPRKGRALLPLVCCVYNLPLLLAVLTDSDQPIETKGLHVSITIVLHVLNHNDRDALFTQKCLSEHCSAASGFIRFHCKELSQHLRGAHEAQVLPVLRDTFLKDFVEYLRRSKTMPRLL